MYVSSKEAREERGEVVVMTLKRSSSEGPMGCLDLSKRALNPSSMQSKASEYNTYELHIELNIGEFMIK